MRTRLKTYCALPLAEQLLFWRIWLCLGVYRLGLRLRSLQSFTAGLTHSAEPLAPISPDARQLQEARRVGYLVAAAASIAPWQASCLVQVLLTQRLLARRGIPGQFCLGVSRSGTLAEETPFAHAWLQVGSEVVNGGGPGDFVVISCFAWS